MSRSFSFFLLSPFSAKKRKQSLDGTTSPEHIPSDWGTRERLLVSALLEDPP